MQACGRSFNLKSLVPDAMPNVLLRVFNPKRWYQMQPLQMFCRGSQFNSAGTRCCNKHSAKVLNLIALVPDVTPNVLPRFSIQQRWYQMLYQTLSYVFSIQRCGYQMLCQRFCRMLYQVPTACRTHALHMDMPSHTSQSLHETPNQTARPTVGPDPEMLINVANGMLDPWVHKRFILCAPSAPY
jgi:hypothetical protein